jgi:hypothetical protein
MDNVFSKAKDKINILRLMSLKISVYDFCFCFVERKEVLGCYLSEKVQGFGIEVYDKAL